MFFAAILFNHAVPVRFEFIEQGAALAWMQTARDFGVFGFFALAGASLKRRLLEADRVKLPSNLFKLSIAAIALAMFDAMLSVLRGAELGPLDARFYYAIYETNLWFFVAYAFAGPLLVSLDRRGMLWTWVCCLGFVMFPADNRLLSPYILQTISLAFVCMVLGMELHGKRVNQWFTVCTAATACSLRIWLDDHSMPVYPALDIILRLVYGASCYLILKEFALFLHSSRPAPRWSSYLFIPYIVQFPLVLSVTVFVSVVFNGAVSVRAQPIFNSFGESLAFMLSVFSLSLVASFALAWLLCRLKIRV